MSTENPNMPKVVNVPTPVNIEPIKSDSKLEALKQQHIKDFLQRQKEYNNVNQATINSINE